MKRWLGIIVCAMLLNGCPERESTKTRSPSKASRTPVLYASNYPLSHFAKRISGPLVDVRLPVPVDGDPAFWNPTPKDILALQQADLIVLNGASYESWLKNVSLPSSRLVVTSAGFKERLIAQDEATTHSHGPDGKHEHSATAFTTWLDLTLAVEQARAIKDALSKRWPTDQGQFRTQFDTLAKELGAWDNEIKTLVEQAPDTPVLFSHPVYQYLARRYGLNGHSLHWEPDEMPSSAMWQQLTRLLESHPAKWMIWEGEPSTEIKARLAKLGIESAVFDPCGNTPDQGDFASMMKQNISALKTVYSRP